MKCWICSQPLVPHPAWDWATCANGHTFTGCQIAQKVNPHPQPLRKNWHLGNGSL